MFCESESSFRATGSLKAWIKVGLVELRPQIVSVTAVAFPAQIRKLKSEPYGIVIWEPEPN